MRQPELVVESSTDPMTVHHLMTERRIDQVPVTDGNRFLGMISRTSIDKGASCAEIGKLLETEFPHVHSDHPLDVALHRMGTSQMSELPVVSRRDIHRLEGVIAINVVLRLYGINNHDTSTPQAP